MTVTSISGAAVVDVPAGLVRPQQTITIRDGCIQAVSKGPAGPSAGLIEARGMYACPGLIDCHVHLFLDAGEDPRISYLESDDFARMRVAAANAAMAIQAGITTVRDCGSPAPLVFRLQRSVERGYLPGPRILACGAPLTRPGGHLHFFGIEVSTAAEVARAIECQAGQGAAFVKLIASGGGLTPGTRPAEADLPAELMRAAVEAARANGLHVSAHCHATESIVRALDAGVDLIEHASFVEPSGRPRFDPAIAGRILSEGTIISPTIVSGARIAEGLRRSDDRNGRNELERARLLARLEHAARFCAAGIPMIAGTDCGVRRTRFDALVDELCAHVAAGKTPCDALCSATCDSARYLRQSALGSIRPGCAADLLLLDGNPLQTLEALRNPLMVIKAGEIVCDRRNIFVSV